MIPLSIFLIIWLVLLGIYGLLALVSIIQMVRFSVAGPLTYLATFGFIAVVLIAIISTGLYLSSVDWSAGITLSGLASSPFISQ